MRDSDADGNGEQSISDLTNQFKTHEQAVQEVAARKKELDVQKEQPNKTTLGQKKPDEAEKAEEKEYKPKAEDFNLELSEDKTLEVNNKDKKVEKKEEGEKAETKTD